MVKPGEAVEPKLLDLIREHLSTSVLGDVMDKMGLRRQFLPPSIRALSPEMKLVGRAMPVREEDCAEGDVGPGDFGLMFKALDDLKADEVYICTGASPNYALWGELMSTQGPRARRGGRRRRRLPSRQPRHRRGRPAGVLGRLLRAGPEGARPRHRLSLRDRLRERHDGPARRHHRR